MQAIDVTYYWKESFDVPHLGHKAIVFYGPPLPMGRAGPMFSVTAWVSIGENEYEEVVPAKHLSDDVEEMVGRAKAGLLAQVAPLVAPG